jgi:antitoxin PrlF
MLADARLTLPDAVLRHLNAIPGDRLEVAASPLGELQLRRITSAPALPRLRLCSGQSDAWTNSEDNPVAAIEMLLGRVPLARPGPIVLNASSALVRQSPLEASASLATTVMRGVFRRGLTCLSVREFCLTFRAERKGAMATLTVTAKGQITLRKDLLRHLGVHPGAKLSVQKLPGGGIEVRADEPQGKISDVFGALKREGQRPVSIEEMNEAIAKGWAGER